MYSGFADVLSPQKEIGSENRKSTNHWKEGVSNFSIGNSAYLQKNDYWLILLICRFANYVTYLQTAHLLNFDILALSES